ncbi:MAG: hydroxymethylglutaryl-CoA lyase, partial [Proteobacteria bacterium]|nr:hydroxymethylglutaryl-CoA lyase [Pseudomonadota bacterium]
MNYPTKVKIVEVSARDGLQNEKQIIATETKLALINDLRASGVQHIEVTGFVSPKWVPQLADSSELCALLTQDEAVSYSALTPNIHGLEKAIAAGIKQIAIFTAASESFNQKNINCSIDESFARFKPLMLLAKKHGIAVRGYVSCVLGCPYEGEIAVNKVVEVAKKLIDIGCFEVSLGDTIGVGTAKQAQEMFIA